MTWRAWPAPGPGPRKTERQMKLNEKRQAEDEQRAKVKAEQAAAKVWPDQIVRPRHRTSTAPVLMDLPPTS